MTSYTVYQFTETRETCVLPTSWVIEGQVKYDSKKASEYAKKGKTPYKKWPTYKVEPICAKLFDSYDAAYRAETILLEKSDLESTDIEAINNPTKIIDKKRQRKPVIFASATTTNSDLSSSSEDDTVAAAKLPSIIITNETDDELVDNTTTYRDQNETDGMRDDNETVEINPIDIITDNNNVMPLSLSTETQVNELKELIIEQNNLIHQQNMKIDNLTALVTNVSNQLKKLKQGNDNYNHVDGNVTTVTRWTLPMETLNDVKELEESLKNVETGSVKEFKSFLLQLGGSTLKTTIKFIIKAIYSLELQQKLNYSGREGKFSTKDLIQTKLIIEVMQRNTSKTQVEAINEYMYHLQHVTDRVRAMTKKIK